MGTVGSIWIKHNDNQYQGIMVHGDSDLECCGKYLLLYWNKEEDIKQLISWGDTSGLRKTLDQAQSAAYAFNGEETVHIMDVKSLCDIADHEYSGSYIYLWNNGKWFHSIGFNRGKSEWIELNETVIKILVEDDLETLRKIALKLLEINKL